MSCSPTEMIAYEPGGSETTTTFITFSEGWHQTDDVIVLATLGKHPVLIAGLTTTYFCLAQRGICVHI